MDIGLGVIQFRICCICHSIWSSVGREDMLRRLAVAYERGVLVLSGKGRCCVSSHRQVVMHFAIPQRQVREMRTRRSDAHVVDDVDQWK